MSLAYAVLATAWISLSDALLAALVEGPLLVQLGTAKGMAFVAVTAAAWYLAISAAPSTTGEALQRRAGRWLPPLALLALGAVIVAVSAASYRWQMQQMRETHRSELGTVASVVGNDLGVWLAEQRSDADVVRNNPLLHAALKEAALRGTSMRDTVLPMLAAIRHDGRYAAVEWWNARGERLLSTSAVPETPTAGIREAVRRAQAVGGTVLSDLHRDASGRARMALCAAVGEGAGDRLQPLGVLVYEYEVARDIEAKLAAWPRESRRGELVLARRDGSELVAMVPLQHGSQRLPTALDGSPDAAPGGLALTVDVPGSDWLIVARLDAADAQAGANALLTQHAVLSLLAFVAAAILAGYWRQRDRLSEALREVDQAHALQEAERRFTATFEQAAVGLCHLDSRGLFLRANPTASHLLGLDEPAGGARLFDLLQLDPGERAALQATLDGRRSLFSHDLRARHQGGGQPWLRLTVSGVKNEAGTFHYAVAVIEDISARKAAALALEQSEARLRSYAEHAPLGVVVLDPQGRIIEANPAAQELSGRSECELWLQRFEPLLSPGAPQHFNFARRPLLRDGHWTFEAPLQLPDGKQRWLAIHAARVNAELTIAFVQDISERKREELRLRRAEAVFRNTQEGLVITDTQGQIVAINPAFCEISGYSEAELIGRNMNVVNSGRHDHNFYRNFWHSLQRHGVWQGEMWNRRKSGEVFPEWLTINAVRDAGGRVLNYVAACMDITATKRSEMALEHLAHHDPLTGLPNRLLLMSTLEHAIHRARRGSQLGAVMMLDLDRFKNVNDSLGHPAGDRLLQEVAQRLRARVRDADTVARLGGDEFVILLEDLSDASEAAHVARTLIEACDEPFVLPGDTRVYVGASIGISLYPSDSDQGDLLIQQADAALYSAKDAGRGAYRFFTDAFTRDAQARLDLEAGLRRALELRQFSLHYQPLVDAMTGQIRGLEALVRWQDPERGTIPPGSFIPLAEDTGLIVPLGEWVLREACQQMQAWTREGIAPPMVAVNLSPRQFALHDLHERLAQILRETGLPPQQLELEITEGALLDAREAGAKLQQLKALGVKLSIDDFGTGYSSLAYLSRYPIDKLKVDQSFVRNIPADPVDMEIAAAVVALAKSLKLHVLAEGVETAAQRDFLRAHGCDLLQGYLYSRPLPPEGIEHLLRDEARALTEA